MASTEPGMLDGPWRTGQSPMRSTVLWGAEAAYWALAWGFPTSCRSIRKIITSVIAIGNLTSPCRQRCEVVLDEGLQDRHVGEEKRRAPCEEGRTVQLSPRTVITFIPWQNPALGAPNINSASAVPPGVSYSKGISAAPLIPHSMVRR
ncbi:hypothetical protein CISG_03852 [Coccidioides immitis RMSCC 3703]|uniref:Uncharacterized protein n=1 Tax=Coccidioides immitis RMSCC 3703 TaxID=454286 RepID=A0A0J8QN70_COCIT|nr:hypothetical protein CISG_03852 [Coccidioides immitis RMSCC 3703]